MEPDVARNEWPLGIVEKTFAGKDGLTRKVHIRVGNKDIKCKEARCKILERPIQKLIMLIENE